MTNPRGKTFYVIMKRYKNACALHITTFMLTLFISNQVGNCIAKILE